MHQFNELWIKNKKQAEGFSGQDQPRLLSSPSWPYPVYNLDDKQASNPIPFTGTVHTLLAILVVPMTHVTSNREKV